MDLSWVDSLPVEARAGLLKELEQKLAYGRIEDYYPDNGPLRRELYPKHTAFFEAGAVHRIRTMIAANRIGKALKHGTRVATPTGWCAVESLRCGDEVISGDGAVTRVTGVYPQGEVELFALSFDGVHEVVTCGEHLWKYQHPRARYAYRRSHGRDEPNPFHGEWVVGNTRELAKFGAGPRMRAVVPNTPPFRLAECAVPFDPYLLGLLLGDGGLSRDSIKFSTLDDELVAALRARFTVTAYGGCNYGVQGATGIIRDLGLLGRTSIGKFIPPRYLRASYADRVALLQGLMDTDGSIHGPGGHMEYSTSSDWLADDVEWLAISLGCKVRRERRHTKDQHGNGLPSWRLALRTGTLCPFRLKRKAERWRPLRETQDWVLHGVKPAGRGLATCIEVAHESHTFVIEHGIVTHNTEGVGGYEVVLHMTGRYPDWWRGRRFNRPVSCWLAGDTSKTVREILQFKLLGPWSEFGKGLIPRDALLKFTPKQGVPETVDTFHIKHVSGGTSHGVFKSYDQKREAFQGTEQDVILLDEEPPLDIYTECLLRTMTTAGLILLTFTPLSGISKLIKHLRASLAWEIGATWDDVPHLSQEVKDELWNAVPSHEREARAKGIPSRGSGVIYAVSRHTIEVEPFQIPTIWPGIGGLDFGWDHPTAGVELRHDRDGDVLYVTKEYQEREKPPLLVASAIKPWGTWLPFAWPHDGLRQDKDPDGARPVAQMYRDEGLNMLPEPASWSDERLEHGVEACVQGILSYMLAGRFKVFRTLTRWLREFDDYHRKDGVIVKEDDDLMDATRVAFMMRRHARLPPQEARKNRHNAPNWRTA